MRLETTLSQRMNMEMRLAPRMIQSMEILQMPIMDLQERLQQELDENPVLELKEASDEPPAEGLDALAEPREERDPGAGELVIDDGGSNELDFDRLDAMSKDWEDHFNEEHRPSRNSIDEEVDRKHDAMKNMASRPQSLQDYLSDQLAFLDVSPEKMRLIRYVIAHIDDNGFLSVPDLSDTVYQKDLRDDPDRARPHRRRCPTMAEMAAGYDHPVTPEQVEEVLLMVQHLDPPGVGARDLKECLLLQVTPETQHRELVRLLILKHLEDI